LEKKPVSRPKVSEVSGFFCSDGHDMWTAASGQSVLVFVPSRSDVPVQRNGARRGCQCFSYGRVQKVKFQIPKALRACICGPLSYGDLGSGRRGQTLYEPLFRNFDFDQWGMPEKREKTTFLNFGIRGKNPIRPRFGRRFFSR
jgi:hypothetical protein